MNFFCQAVVTIIFLSCSSICAVINMKTRRVSVCVCVLVCLCMCLFVCAFMYVHVPACLTHLINYERFENLN